MSRHGKGFQILDRISHKRGGRWKWEFTRLFVNIFIYKSSSQVFYKVYQRLTKMKYNRNGFIWRNRQSLLDYSQQHSWTMITCLKSQSQRFSECREVVHVTRSFSRHCTVGVWGWCTSCSWRTDVEMQPLITSLKWRFYDVEIKYQCRKFHNLLSITAEST